ncbi:hypothetical protein [Gilvimarinus algae]|uniref:Uncharacterized protein n=1 Tax=Gilvimarinus algae TaxID=3058037 RepID=A0ABT8TES5_9GAMM|nr:hypothetical protein [Gilvimarinus sp. SDUM040014]MDO3380817.1 hypothetical protein [Gilvimarinus sp. SDUM040014]
MNWKSVTIIAFAAATGAIGAQYFFGSLTISGALAAIGSALAAGIAMASVQSIRKDKGSRNNGNL